MPPVVIAAADPTTGWEIASALGTVAAAAATTAAIVVALIAAARDRRAADKALLDQLEAARIRQAADHAELRKRQSADHQELRRRQDEEHAELRRRQAQEHEIDLLTSLAGALGDLVGHDGAPMAAGATMRGRAIAAALPATRQMPAVLLLLGLNDAGTSDRFREAYGVPYHPSRGPSEAVHEIADRIAEVADR